MTTIAYDGKTLAGDTLACWNNTPHYRTKIYATPKNKRWKAVGMSGNSYHCQPVVDYIRGATKKEPHQFEDEGNIILIDKDNQPWVMNGKQVPIPAPVPFAIGSGGDFALGAMVCGKTAAEAVAIAAILDVNTGGAVDEIAIVTE